MYQAVINSYHPHAETEDKEFQTKSSLSIAARDAALSIAIGGQKKSHQRKVRNEALREAANTLDTHSKHIDISGDFEELYDSIETLIGGISGIGDLTIYDIATRIGIYKNIRPKNFVYLHAGAKKGAIAIGVPVQRRVPVTSFPSEIEKLGAAEIENFLCIEREALEAIATGQVAPRKSQSSRVRSTRMC